MRSKSQQIISQCLGLHTQNPGLREVDLEDSPKTGTDKINMLKQGRNTPPPPPQKKSKLYGTAWSQIWIPALTEVDLQSIANRGTNRTRALVSLYSLSQSLHLKESPNQMTQKSIKVDPMRWSGT